MLTLHASRNEIKIKLVRREVVVSTHTPLFEDTVWQKAQQIAFIVDTEAAISMIHKLYLTTVVIHPTNINYFC